MNEQVSDAPGHLQTIVAFEKHLKPKVILLRCANLKVGEFINTSPKTN